VGSINAKKIFITFLVLALRYIDPRNLFQMVIIMQRASLLEDLLVLVLVVVVLVLAAAAVVLVLVLVAFLT
jgi:hypothetical protein